MNDSEKEITIALQAWLEESQTTIATRFGDLVQLIGLPRWHAIQSGSFKYYPYTPMYRFSELDNVIFQNSSTWSEVERLAEIHPNLKRHFSEFVSSTSGSGRAFSLQDLCRSMLPTLKLVDENSVHADTDFNTKLRVQEFLEVINSDTIEQMTVWPVRGLATDTPVVLDNLTEFRELTIEEKLHCLNFEIIRPMMQQEIAPEHSRWFGLCRKTNDKKIFGHNTPADLDTITKRFAEQEQALEDFLVSVPLANDRVAFHAGGISAAPHFEAGGMLTFGTIGYGTGASNHLQFAFVNADAKLSAQDAQKLYDVWNFIQGSKNGDFKKRVGNAAKRLFYAETRTKQDDVLVDLMVAAESLYLNSDRNELRYRMSLNAALWADTDDSEQRRIFDAFRNAYDLRSKVVHGSTATAEDVAASTSVIKPILKNGIRKALDHLNKTSEVPDWESMIFTSKDEILEKDQESDVPPHQS